MLLDCWNEFLFVAKSTMTNSPGFLVGRPLGHKDAVTLMEDGSVRYDGSSAYSPETRSDANVHEHQSALAKMKQDETKSAKLLGM